MCSIVVSENALHFAVAAAVAGMQMWQGSNALELVYRMLHVPEAALVGLASLVPASSGCSVYSSSSGFLTISADEALARIGDILGMIINLQGSYLKQC